MDRRPVYLEEVIVELRRLAAAELSYAGDIRGDGDVGEAGRCVFRSMTIGAMASYLDGWDPLGK